MFNNAKDTQHKQHHFPSASCKQYCKSNYGRRCSNECWTIFINRGRLFNVKIILYFQAPWPQQILYILPHATIFFTKEMNIDLDAWIWRWYALWKSREFLTQPRSITSQETRILQNTFSKSPVLIISFIPTHAHFYTL